MLRFPLIHPPLLAALGAAGHGARVLIADANYSHSTNVGPRAQVIHLTPSATSGRRAELGGSAPRCASVCCLSREPQRGAVPRSAASAWSGGQSPVTPS